MAVEIPFQKHLDFEYGVADTLSPLVRRVIANNPGAFTFFGTGTYIVGRDEVMVIDPGPADEQHISAILSAVEGETITHILVTHTHLDHSHRAARCCRKRQMPKPMRLVHMVWAEHMMNQTLVPTGIFNPMYCYLMVNQLLINIVS